MTALLERGRARFFVRPRVMLATARNVRDVQRFFVLLAPEGRRSVRRVVIGRKRMPDPARHDKEWAYVDRVAESFGEALGDVASEGYDTKTEGWRTQAGPSEVARGSYVIRPHDDHVHLDYALEDVPAMDDLGLLEHGSMIAAVFNPQAKWRGPVPRGQLALDLPDVEDDFDGPREPTIYPDELQEKFGEKKFAPLEPELLDHVGCEIVLIGHEARIDEAHGDRSEEAARLRPGRRPAGA